MLRREVKAGLGYALARRFYRRQDHSFAERDYSMKGTGHVHRLLRGHKGIGSWGEVELQALGEDGFAEGAVEEHLKLTRVESDTPRQSRAASPRQVFSKNPWCSATKVYRRLRRSEKNGFPILKNSPQINALTDL